MMNWSRLGQSLRSGRLFAEFFESLPPEKILPSDTGGQEWTCCLKADPWRVELCERDKTARLVNVNTRRCVCSSEIALYKDLKLFLQRKTGCDGAVRKKIALVLSGGGAKGAYQIGVWDAMRQLGICQEIGGIAGTSIGAVNALLFAREDYVYAQNLWLKLSEPFNRAEEQKKLKELYRLKPFAPGELILKDNFLSQAELQKAVSLAVSGGQGDRIKQKYYIFTTAVRKETFEKNRPEATYMSWNLLSNAEIINAVLASSALPVVYNPVKCGSALYYDGGLKDNTPVEPLYQCGFRRFLVVHLRQDGPEVQAVRDKLAAYGGCQAVHIVPGPEFEDGPAAMIKLTPEMTRQRIAAGRRDTLALRDSLSRLAAKSDQI